MEIYGIGILSKDVQKFYTECKVITDTSQLEAALLEVIKTKILNR